MFRNSMPRYEILSEEAIGKLEAGWRRLVTEVGVEFDSDRALALFQDAGQKVDAKSGQALERRLLTTFQSTSHEAIASMFRVSVSPWEVVSVGGKDYRVNLRFKRDYKPYSVTAIDVRKDDYVGPDVVRRHAVPPGSG